MSKQAKPRFKEYVVYTSKQKETPDPDAATIEVLVIGRAVKYRRDWGLAVEPICRVQKSDGRALPPLWLGQTWVGSTILVQAKSFHVIAMKVEALRLTLLSEDLTCSPLVWGEEMPAA